MVDIDDMSIESIKAHLERKGCIVNIREDKDWRHAFLEHLGIEDEPEKFVLDAFGTVFIKNCTDGSGWRRALKVLLEFDGYIWLDPIESKGAVEVRCPKSVSYKEFLRR